MVTIELKIFFRLTKQYNTVSNILTKMLLQIHAIQDLLNVWCAIFWLRQFSSNLYKKLSIGNKYSYLTFNKIRSLVITFWMKSYFSQNRFNYFHLQIFRICIKKQANVGNFTSYRIQIWKTVLTLIYTTLNYNIRSMNQEFEVPVQCTSIIPSCRSL